jgi:hypothetical protein
VPPPAVGKKQKAESAVIQIKVDGLTYVVRPGEVSAIDAAALRRACGFSLRSLLASAEEDPDLDTVAALVWLARRQRGEKVAFDAIAQEIGYDNDFDVVPADASDVEDDEGEGPAAS